MRLCGRGIQASALFTLKLIAELFIWRGVAISSKVSLPPLDEECVFLVYDIGLAPGAAVSLELSNDQPVNNTYIMMLTSDQWATWQQEQVCLRGSDGTDLPSSYFGSWWRTGIVDSIKVGFKITAPRSNRYSIIVLNPLQQLIKLKGSWSMINPGGEQLPLQELKVPMVLIGLSGLFTASWVILAALLLSAWAAGRSAIHLLMVLVLLFKSAVLFLQWCDRELVSHNGTDSVVSEVSWQLLDKVQTILELMMFLLISLGWKFLRNSLNVTEVRFAVGISVISFYLGVFEVACTKASTCSGYRLSRYILHSLCYLVVIVAMNFNLQMVQAQIADAPASIEAGKLYQKHRAYQLFRWIFLVFIIAPTAELFLKVSMMPWDADWVYILVQQMRTWILYACVIMAFRPEPAPLRVFKLTVLDGSEDELEGHGGDE